MIRLGKFRGWAILAIVFPAISFFNIPAQASPALNAPIQITSNPGEDFAPSVGQEAGYPAPDFLTRGPGFPTCPRHKP